MDEPLPPPPSTPVAHPEGVYDYTAHNFNGCEDTLTVHRVAAQIHPEPTLVGSYPPSTHVPNGPICNGPYILRDGPYYLRNGPVMTMGGPHSASAGQDASGGLPEPPPILTTFGRPTLLTGSAMPGLSIPSGMMPVRHRPLDPRVEELRGRRSPKSFASAVNPLGRNGFCRPSRRVTFLVEPVPEVEEEEEEEEDEELRSLHQPLRQEDEEVDDNEEQQQHKLRLGEVDGSKSGRTNTNIRSDARVRFLIDPAADRQKSCTVVSGVGRDMSRCGRGPGLSSLCSQSSVGCGMGGPVGGHRHIASTCSSSSASRAGSAGSLEGVGVPSLEGEVGCSDCAALYPITDDALLHNLHTRYKRDQIYVLSSTWSSFCFLF